MSVPPRMLIVDPAPVPLLSQELDAYLDMGLALTINVRQLPRPQRLMDSYGPRLQYVDFDGFSAETLIRQIGARDEGFEVIKLRAGVPITPDVLAAARRPNLRHRLAVVARAASGIDNVDLDAAANLGVIVTHTPGANAPAVAEFALGLMIAAVRRIGQHDAAVRGGRWVDPALPLPSGSLAGASLGIVGPGAIGARVARLAQAFGMNVAAYGSHRFTPADADRLGVTFAPTLPELLQASDVVSLHVPLTSRTEGMMNRQTLGLMRPGSVLVNTSRGRLVDESALNQALSDPAAPVSFAAIDVFEREGQRFDSVLAGNPNCILTPHIGGMTLQAMTDAARRLADSIRYLLSGDDGRMVVGCAEAVRVLRENRTGSDPTVDRDR